MIRYGWCLLLSKPYGGDPRFNQLNLPLHKGLRHWHYNDPAYEHRSFHWCCAWIRLQHTHASAAPSRCVQTWAHHRLSHDKHRSDNAHLPICTCHPQRHTASDWYPLDRKSPKLKCLMWQAVQAAWRHSCMSEQNAHVPLLVWLTAAMPADIQSLLGINWNCISFCWLYFVCFDFWFCSFCCAQCKLRKVLQNIWN